MEIPKIILFWSGGKEPNKWWTGIETILKKVESGEIQAQVVWIISNYSNGWVANKARNFGVEPKIIEEQNFPKRDKENKSWKKTLFSKVNKNEITKIYKEILKEYKPDYIFMSWWLKYILWLPINKTINIHPGPTKEPYGGKGMYWDKIHKKIWEDYKEKKIKRTCITMHYVSKKIDDGPIVAQIPVNISKCKSWEDIKKAVNKVEQKYQWKITKLIIEWKITWSWEKDDPVVFPKFYRWKKWVDLRKSILTIKKKQKSYS